MNYPDVDYDRVNEEWLEAAQENFQEAVQDNNMSLARAIIKDIEDKGFISSAHILERELNWISDKKVLV